MKNNVFYKQKILIKTMYTAKHKVNQDNNNEEVLKFKAEFSYTPHTRKQKKELKRKILNISYSLDKQGFRYTPNNSSSGQNYSSSDARITIKPYIFRIGFKLSGESKNLSLEKTIDLEAINEFVLKGKSN